MKASGAGGGHPGLEDGLQTMISEASLGMPTRKNGKELPMKGTCGELREFRCRDCRQVISKYFSHFERPQSFRVVECHHCHGKSDLIEEQEVDLNWASKASVPASGCGLRTESVDWVFKH